MSRRHSRWLIALGLFVASHAQADAATPLAPVRTGYAFDFPRILEQQRLFGRAHGIALLAEACTGTATYREPVSIAYSQWQAAQADTIANGMRELAQYHFAENADEATRQDIARVLKLGDRLALTPDTKAFNEACATFGAALQKPRYDLRTLLRRDGFLARLSMAQRIEGMADKCRIAQPDSERMSIDSAMKQWRLRYASKIDEAKVGIETDWPAIASELTPPRKPARAYPQPLTFAVWMSEQREHGKQSANPAKCRALSARLLTAEADPDEQFNRTP